MYRERRINAAALKPLSMTLAQMYRMCELSTDHPECKKQRLPIAGQSLLDRIVPDCGYIIMNAVACTPSESTQGILLFLIQFYF